MLSPQELNVIGQLNFSVETNVLEFQKDVVVASTFLILTMATVFTVARNPTHPVEKPGMGLIVKDKYFTNIIHVMDLVNKKQGMDTQCYPVLTKRNVMKEFLHAMENLNAQSKLYR